MVSRFSPHSNAELVDGLLNRDPDSLARAYDQYGALAYSILFRITHNRAVAEDLTQEVFLRVWMRIADYKIDRGTLAVWIVSIARNLAIDNIRSVRVRMGFEHYPPEKARPYSDSSFENLDLIRKTFLALTLPQRQLLEMAYFEGCSQSEIAARLRTPLGTVKSRIRAAMQQMRVAFAAMA